jgi:hypothetical protein
LGIFGIDPSALSGGQNVDPFAEFQIQKKRGDELEAQFAKSPKVQKEIEYFKQRAKEIKTTDEFFKDFRLVQLATSAFSLDGEENFLGRLKKVMTEDPTDENALQNRLTDKRFKEIAEAFNFSNGIGKLSSDSFLKTLEDRYITNEYEKSLGEKDPSLRNVAYFKRNAGNIEDSLSLLGDKIFREVALTALNSPQEIASQSIDKQREYIDRSLDVEKLQDPEFLDKFLDRYLIQVRTNQLQSDQSQGGGAGGLVSLLV